MAEVRITREQWDSVADLYEAYGYRPTVIARKLGLTFRVVKLLWEESVCGLPPIEPVVKARHEATKARIEARKTEEIPPVSPHVHEPIKIKLHVASTPTLEAMTPHTPIHQTDLSSTPASQSAPPSQAESSPTLGRTTPAPANLVPPPQPPSALLALSETGDTASDLMRALDEVHRELARALPREALLVRGIREQAIGLANGGTQAVRAFETIMTRLSQKLIQASMRDEIEERRAFTILTRLSRLVKVATEHAKQAFELQRLIAGLPQSISATTTVDAGKDRVSDLKALTEQLQALHERRSKAIDVDARPYSGEESDDSHKRSL